MKLIPVLDLMGAKVVRAVAGRRDRYRPIVSGLCPGADPCDLTAALLKLHLFSHFYIADLDAILGRGDNLDQIAGIRARFPALELWVDCGVGDQAAYDAWNARQLGNCVIGSESLRDVQLLTGRARPAVLSLDFKGEHFLGPEPLLARPEIWPENVIYMNLTRLGAGAGPDLAAIAALVSKAKGKKIFAAGGVRGPADLARLKRAGVAGVLLASALHDRGLSANEVAIFAGK